MGTDAIWHELYEKKLNWAYKGRENFYEAIDDEDIKEIYKNSANEINVCVYGRSQVGKTTLILKLIGIEEHNIQKLGDILRGRREKGSSATIVATVYAMSNDECFYYQDATGNVLKYTEHELENKLAELRREVYRGVSETNIVKISIPKKYFIIKAEDINIIDLPGIESADVEEYTHVARIIKKFVPISNMVILIERADQVAYFKELKLPGIDYWYDEIDRFKIVLTRSVSNRSTKKDLRKMGKVDKNKYVELFENDICTDTEIKNLPDHMVFPLEYGESWDELKKSEPDITSKVIPILDQLYKDLIKDIIDSKNKYNQFIMSMKMLNRINKVLERKIKVFNEEISIQKANIIKKSKTHNSLMNILKESQEQLRIIEDKNKKLEVVLNKSLIKFDNRNHIGIRKVTSLREYVEEEIATTSLESDRFVKNSYEENIKINNHTVSIGYEEASSYLKQLDRYFLNEYFIDSTFYSDENKAEDLVRRIKDKVAIDLINQVSEDVAKMKKANKSSISQIKSKIRFVEKKCISINKDIQTGESILKAIRDELDEFKIKSEKDRITDKNFKVNIYNSYHEEMKEASKIINDIKSTAEIKVLYLLYMYLISDELSKLEGLLG
ncbi:hypothetical protein LL037_21205 [Clostridium estertheticum]|uniref:hypothetical protein n=1 Tax=Clostridium estertheticum TaxID=238834 RepID=UPI001C0C9E76|nr:hypothetical protein [Clostridium estertheticum]MBU3198263.1 hypothetical protein [Clostridium estertheticum]WAG64954.1 hypothetical protein LL037_21205 [Clostridium estertheticum]